MMKTIIVTVLSVVVHGFFQDHHVVLLCPSELDSTLRILLQVPVWSQRVTYLKGSALIDEDLIRARCACIFKSTCYFFSFSMYAL